MIPWLKAQEWHGRNCPGESFWERVGWHFSCGYVWSTPEVFMLAHTVHWDDAAGVVHDAGMRHNAWFVELAAGCCRGAVGKLMGLAPYPLPWVCYRRRNEPRVRAFRWEKLSGKAGV